MTITNSSLKKRIIEISYRHKLSHLGSCLTAVDIIAEIYEKKESDEKFVLSAGHAHLAHLVVMEAYYDPEFFDAEEMLVKYGIHCDRRAGCDVSTGSLGQGLPIAVGMALADRTKNVHCLISDGECAEGSICEAMRIRDENKLHNLKVYINLNGWAAYRETLPEHIPYGYQMQKFIEETSVEQLPFLKGQDAHYYVMNEDDYQLAMEILK